MGVCWFPAAGARVPDTLTADTIIVIREADGTRRLEEGSVPPDEVAFSPQLVGLLADGGSPWAWIEVQAGDPVVVMKLCPVELRYRLTGETDLTGGMVAVRVDEEGRPWSGN